MPYATRGKAGVALDLVILLSAIVSLLMFVQNTLIHRYGGNRGDTKEAQVKHD